MPKEPVGPPKTIFSAAVHSKPEVGLTAEVEKSHQNQVGVIVIPQSAQPLPRTSTGSQTPPRSPTIPAYGPSSSLGMFPDSQAVIKTTEWAFLVNRTNNRKTNIYYIVNIIFTAPGV